MENEEINRDKTVYHWLTKSDQDYQTMINLFNSKDYNWSLFLGHLIIERLLKAVIVKRSNLHAPFTHDLRRLAKYSDLEFTDEEKKQLDTITTFNINARYDDYKQEFYRKCTLEYTSYWIERINYLREWIKMKL